MIEALKIVRLSKIEISEMKILELKFILRNG